PHEPKYLIPWLETLDISANRFNPARDITSEACIFRFQKPFTHQTNKRWIGSHDAVITRVYRRGMNLDQYLIFLGSKFFDLANLKNIRGSVVCQQDCFHCESFLIIVLIRPSSE